MEIVFKCLNLDANLPTIDHIEQSAAGMSTIKSGKRTGLCVVQQLW